MSGHAQPVSKEKLWGGGGSPFGISYGKMMMWYFLVSDALTFSGLITSYGVIRHSLSKSWPVGEQVFRSLPFLDGEYPLIYVALMTFILIISSVTMVLAVEAGHRRDNKGVIKWLGFTILGGMFFLGSQAWEWSHFIHGSGGGFQINKTVMVNAENEKGEMVEISLAPGTWVHMDHKFGHAYEHALEEGTPFHNEGTAFIFSHEDHAEAGHGHGEEHAEAAAEEESVELTLMINKYVLVHDGEKDIRDLKVTGDEALKLWSAMESNTLAFGANMSKNEYGPQQYANFFFFITGFHGFHVFSGVIINIIIWLMVIGGSFLRLGHYEMIEKIGLYWHFVDLVWVFVFTFYYLV